MSKFYQTAIARQAKSRESRLPYMLMVDEAGEMLTPTISEILVGARKYGLGLTLAHQFLDQLKGDKEVYGAVTGSSRIKVCFQVSSDDARRMTDEFGGFTATDLMNRPRLHALARVGPRDASFNLEVRHIPEGIRPYDEAYRDILGRTRARYSTPIAQIKAEMGDLGEVKRPSGVNDPFSKLSKKSSDPESGESSGPDEGGEPSGGNDEPPKPEAPPAPKKKQKPKVPKQSSEPPSSAPIPPASKPDEAATKSKLPDTEASAETEETKSVSPEEAGEAKLTHDPLGEGNVEPTVEPAVAKQIQPQVGLPAETPPAPPEAPGGGEESHELLDATSEALKNQIIQSVASWGFSYETEKSYPKHSLRVDLFLRLGAREIVCQICATTGPEHEVQNLLKCVSAGCKEIALVSDKTARRHKIERLLRPQLAEAQQSLVRFFTVRQFVKFLSEIGLEASKSPPPGAPALGDKSIQSADKLTVSVRPTPSIPEEFSG